SKGGRGSARMSGRKPKSAAKARRSGGGTSRGTGELARALAELDGSHAMTAQMVNSIPADKGTWECSPADNHVLWTLGHLALTYSWLATMFDGKKADLPVDYEKLFGFKTTPVNDPSKYPSLESVRQNHEAAYQRLTEAIRNTPDSEAHKAPSI